MNFEKNINLAEERLGSKVLSATDDFFAEKENLIKPGRGIFIEDKYTDRGKWMDGWESRRKRTPGHDHCTIQLGLSGNILGFDIDTNHFLGNHPPEASVEACYSPDAPLEHAVWTEILPKSPLKPGSQNLFESKVRDKRFSHVRLHIYPDGGVARFRVYGEVCVDWESKSKTDLIDLASVKNGGRVLSCNDMFFSSKDNLIMPGRGKNMGDGWETKRRRTPGNDWVIFKLGRRGVLDKVEIDTAHFKGNYPESFCLHGINQATDDDLDSAKWALLLDKQPLEADQQHYFGELKKIGPITHVKMSIFPDGGISRVRLLGYLE